MGALAGFVRAKAGRPDVLDKLLRGGDYLDPVPAQPDGGRPGALRSRSGTRSAQGIVVVFSAGNGSFSAEAQVPGVLAAGGVFASAGLELQASTYSSGYHSAWFGGVDLPTGLGASSACDQGARYIMMPIPGGLPIDVERATAGTGSGAGDPPDGTGPNDGWALFSAGRPRPPRSSPAPGGSCAASARARPRRR